MFLTRVEDPIMNGSTGMNSVVTEAEDVPSTQNNSHLLHPSFSVDEPLFAGIRQLVKLTLLTGSYVVKEVRKPSRAKDT